MDKKTKQLFNAGPGRSLYDMKWVEKAATQGFEEYYKALCESLPENENIGRSRHGISILYYSAFESALNTFYRQVLHDNLTEVEICMNELGQLTARIKMNKKTRK